MAIRRARLWRLETGPRASLLRRDPADGSGDKFTAPAEPFCWLPAQCPGCAVCVRQLLPYVVARVIHLPASVRVYLCLTPCEDAPELRRTACSGARGLWSWMRSQGTFCIRQPSTRPDQDFVLGRRPLRDVEQASRRGHVRLAVRRGRAERPARDQRARIDGSAERNRPRTSEAAQTLSAAHLRTSPHLFILANRHS